LPAIQIFIIFLFKGTNENSFLSDGTNATFRVMFKEPIEVQANTNYTASATLKVSSTAKLVLFGATP
jgi:hypothetical protein